MKKGFLLFILGIITFVACRKGSLPEENYFGSVAVSQVGTTDAVDLDVYFDGKKLGTILADGTLAGFMLKAGAAGRLSIYRTGSDTLVADTTITIPQNDAVAVKVISSLTLGANGFINGGEVGADSVKVQLINSLNTTLYPYPDGVDICVYTYVSNKITDSIVTIKNVMPGKLDPRVITLRHVDSLGKGIFYVVRLKDPATDQFISNRANSTNFFSFLNTSTGYNGHLNLIQYYDNAGDATTNRILVKVTTLIQ